MSLLYSVVFSSRCTSNHHRLAVDALRHLQSPDAARWHDLFLHHYAAYLEGAKAPDEKFKDFKNHVLHVRDGYWGGAAEAAEKWYGETLRALTAKDWKTAAYNAGVMSHYIADPIQPFHTAQTETENVIHRAVEQSFSKAYGQFQDILDANGGYKDVKLPTGKDWLVKAVRAGADASNPLYETIIDHYDFKRGAKKPLEGLDDALRQAIAPLIGRAAVTIARVLDRVFEEAAVKPPMVLATLDGFFAQMTAPIEKIAANMADGKERALVLAMYKEYAKTGKVSKTLPDDDREVRAQYAAEVLKVPVATLDAELPRAIGTAHGQALSAEPKAAKPAPQTEARQPVAAKPALQPAAAKPAPPPAAEKPIKAKPVKEKPAKAAKAPAEPKLKAAPVKRTSAKKLATQPEPHRIEDSPFAVLATGVAPAARDDVQESAGYVPPPPPPPGVRLNRDDHIIDAPAIGPKAAARFEAIGFKTVADLLEASPDEIAKSLRASHMTPPIIRDWQAQALLACTLPNVRSMDAQAMVACQIRDFETLAKQDAKKLLAQMEAFFQTPNGKQIARSSKPAAIETVRTWIEAAKKTPRAASVAA